MIDERTYLQMKCESCERMIVGGSSESEIIDRAKKAGWTINRYETFCPKHKPTEDFEAIFDR